VTFDQVAYNDLAGGAVLRFDPEDGGVRYLAYPAQPSAWKQAPFYQGTVPNGSWRHLAGCTCPACSSASPPDESSPVTRRSREEG